MSLRGPHLRYLLAVYELGQRRPAVGTTDVARQLERSKASVTNMMEELSGMGLVDRERYGKIALTDTGAAVARELQCCVSRVMDWIPSLELPLSAEEVRDLAQSIVLNLPEACRRQLADRADGVQP